MPRCFVIQPFDKGEFDKRYDGVFAPAIEKAGFEAYRVDRDPTVIIPIETIESNIREADVCLADISLEKPNVWYEVGFAVASKKNVILVCKEDSDFPFDVRHRAIITYVTHSPRDFEKLQDDIVERLKAYAKQTTLLAAISPVKPTHGLTAAEMLALVLIMEDRLTPYSGLSPYSIAGGMERGGFTRLAVTLALQGLLEKAMIEVGSAGNEDGEECVVYRITSLGVSWCMENQSRFKLTVEPQPSRSLPAPQEDEDIPF